MDRNRLEAASRQGIISEEQVERLLEFFQTGDPVLSGENSGEQLRFIRSFGDIFITLGIVLVSFAVSRMQLGVWSGLVPLAILVGLSEWLVGVRRLALPGIALLGAILFFADKAFLSLPLDRGQAELVASVGMIALSGLFYLRYKMPFAFLAMAAGLLLFVHRLLGLDSNHYPLILAGYGLVTFLVAMWFDSRDTGRQNRYSDTGFWLHMLAAPLIAKGVMTSVFQAGLDMPMREIVVVGFFLAFFLVALFVDRRALMVSGLLFALAALLNLFKMDLLLVEGLVWIVFAGLGLVMIFVGVNWYSIRTLIFGRMGQDGLAGLVPPFAGEKQAGRG